MCVNLYPFEQTVARGDASEEEIVENIDIGGPTMIRAAAKNNAFAAVLVDPGDYERVLERAARLRRQAVALDAQALAAKAFACTARYDAAIATWFALRTYEGFPPSWRDAYEKVSDLRYGENPHQRAAFYARVGSPRTCSPAWGSCTARSCRSTTCSTSAPRASWWRSSTSRRARSSSTTTRAAAPSATAAGRPTNAPSRAIRRAPTAA